MKFEFFIAKRYLLRGRKNSFISIISLVSIIGIAIGVAALIVAMALINGFQGDIKDKILNSTSHIMLNNIIGDGFDGYDPIIKNIKSKFPGIKSANPVVYGTVLVKGTGRDGTGAVLKGIDFRSPRDEIWLQELSRDDWPLKRNTLLIGRRMADKLMLEKGDSCQLVIPQVVLSPMGMMPRLKPFKISGVFESGLYEIDNTTVITNLKNAQRLFGLKNKINYIQIYLHKVFDSDRIAAKLKKDIPPSLSIITWKELNASLYTALKLEKTVLFFTLTLIIIVASLNIIAGLILLVIQKIRDIGILLSTGATATTIKRIFFIQGGIIGITGTITGTLIGLFICFLANKDQWIKIPSEIYHMSYVPFHIGWVDLLLVIFVSIIISFCATLIPSQKAASVNVIDALKNE